LLNGYGETGDNKRNLVIKIMQTIKVSGMHCDACKTLITMEIEELGLASKVDSIQLKEENNGTINIYDATEDELKSLVEAINNIGDYSAEVLN